MTAWATAFAASSVYEPDTAAARFPFARRLARCGLRSFVAVPLLVEQRSGVFGVLLVARTAGRRVQRQ